MATAIIREQLGESWPNRDFVVGVLKWRMGCDHMRATVMDRDNCLTFGIVSLKTDVGSFTQFGHVLSREPSQNIN